MQNSTYTEQFHLKQVLERVYLISDETEQKLILTQAC